MLAVPCTALHSNVLLPVILIAKFFTQIPRQGAAWKHSSLPASTADPEIFTIRMSSKLAPGWPPSVALPCDRPITENMMASAVSSIQTFLYVTLRTSPMKAGRLLVATAVLVPSKRMPSNVTFTTSPNWPGTFTPDQRNHSIATRAR